MALIEGPGPQQHPFFREQCPARGPGLSHTQNGTSMDPCADCGQSWTDAGETATQRRLRELGSLPARPRNEWAAHTFQPTITGLCLRCRHSQAEGNHPAGVGTPPIMEPGLAKGKLLQYIGGGQYEDGDPNGPGRGPLSPAWMNWAGLHKWKRNGE